MLLLRALHLCALSLTFSAVSTDDFLYDDFPDDFLWGVATSSYQIEGAWNLDGKSILMHLICILRQRMDHGSCAVFSGYNCYISQRSIVTMARLLCVDVCADVKVDVSI